MIDSGKRESRAIFHCMKPALRAAIIICDNCTLVWNIFFTSKSDHTSCKPNLVIRTKNQKISILRKVGKRYSCKSNKRKKDAVSKKWYCTTFLLQLKEKEVFWHIVSFFWHIRRVPAFSSCFLPFIYVKCLKKKKKTHYYKLSNKANRSNIIANTVLVSNNRIIST